MWRLVALLLALTPGASTALADDKTAIGALYDRWDIAVQSSSVEQYTAVLDEHVRLILPGAPDIQGRDNYGAFLQNVLPVADYKLSLVGPIDIEVFGDIAITEYHKKVEMTLHEAQKVSEPGALTADISINKYIDVLRRQSDGSWRVYRHAWTPSEHNPS